MDEIFINMISPYFCTKLVLHRLCTYLVPSEIYTVLALPDFCTDEILKRIFTEDEINNADIIFIDVVDWISIDLSIDLMVLFSLNKRTFVSDRIDAYTHHDIQNRSSIKKPKMCGSDTN
ncbi:hypothetical protein Rs2_09645 [Raphanus sativus]|nr:hypothetical protein Rs2_49482 [Raphanus sativus]KAJ4905987.1 hypothetical protein Rs2_09645 [Raphanus sativus]